VESICVKVTAGTAVDVTYEVIVSTGTIRMIVQSLTNPASVLGRNPIKHPQTMKKTESALLKGSDSTDIQMNGPGQYCERQVHFVHRLVVRRP
jgi:hypothetical protein